VKLSDDVVVYADHVTLRLNVENPKLWSAEIPNLYRAVVELHTADGTLIEASLRCRFPRGAD
jgi:beta-galactosidase/beta-glucuronidase